MVRRRPTKRGKYEPFRSIGILDSGHCPTQNLLTNPHAMDSILVVEDEPLILELITDALEMYGYRVRAFASADLAWQFIQESGHLPRLLITDLRMPGQMDGLELAKRLRDSDAQVPIVVASGFHPAARELHSLNVHWLIKPFAIEQLHTICRKLAPLP